MAKNTRRLIKFSNYSLCLTIPKQAIIDYQLKKGDNLEIEYSAESSQIIISLPTKNNKKPDNKLADKNKALRW